MVQFKKKRRFAGVARTHHLLKKVDENFIKRFRLLLGDGRDSAFGGTMASAIASGSLRWPVVFARTLRHLNHTREKDPPSPRMYPLIELDSPHPAEAGRS